MSLRQRQILRGILEVLNLQDGAQITEQLLHAEVNLRVTPCATRAEFEDALQVCDRSGYAIGVLSKFSGKLWCMSDLGQAARMEMK